jgi:elongation of very long chain fatty acids protein 6
MSFDSLTLEKMSSSIFDSYMYLRPMFDIKPNSWRGDRTQNSTQFLYSHIFGFETLFQSMEFVESLRLWMERNWTLSVWTAVLYCILIYYGRLYMSKRKRYELRLPLIAWNIFLASFSILGTIRVLPEFRYSLLEKGVEYSVCDNSYAYGIPGFWAFMFIISKLPELIDTVFIVFRQQQLIFLHWYHHATVLIYCWHSYKEFAASGRWFMTMNYFVHSLMYSYYACKAMRIKVPSFVSQIITTSQILQMLAGVYVNYVAYTTKAAQRSCRISDENILISSLMYLSYFVLFFNFFVNAYVFKAKSRSLTNNVNNKNKNEVNKLVNDLNNNQLENKKLN